MSTRRSNTRPPGAKRDWDHRAACRGADTAMWFPDPKEPAEAAKAVCAGCPVRDECLDYALASRQRFGVWGGMSEQERRRLNSTPNRRRTPGRR